MAELKIEYSAASASAQLVANMDKAGKKARKALMDIAEEAAQEIRSRGISDIHSAGRYGRDWETSFHVDVEVGDENNVIVSTSSDKPYFNFLMRGGPIKGDPLLWIPTSNMDIRVPASQYPGRLIRATGKSGIPILIDPNVESSNPGWRHGEVMYTGEQFVIIPQKFHTLEIIRDVARGLKSKYKIAYSTAS